MSALLQQFHFLRPWWLLALLALPLLLAAWRRRREASEPWRAACDPHLLPHLLLAGAAARSRLPQLLLALGFVLAVLAQAGPAFRQLPQPLARAESALIVALDLSDRMRATDLKPNRLARARFKVADLLQRRREGQTALVAYAGDAFVVAPLTDDAASLSDLLASLTPETMPLAGQRAERAIALARRLLHDAGFARGDLLLVTDRADAAALAAAERARADGLRVSVLGVGTAAGTPVRLPHGGFLQDERGDVLLPRLDASALRSLAEAGGGRYAELHIDARDLATLALDAVATSTAELRPDERTRAEYRDEGPFLLLLLLPLAALAFRRGWMGALLLGCGMGLVPPPVAAFEWSALWQRPDQRAWQALQQDQPAQALELARDPALRGSAAYRGEDFPQAATEFAQRDDADAHYNRGNALARAQRYEEALAAYDEALRRAPDMVDAQANRRSVQEFLQQQQQQQQQGEPESKQGGEGQPQPPEQAQDPQDGGEESESSSRSEGQPQPRDDASAREQGEAQDSPSAEEQQQAQEQFAEQMQQALEQQQEGDKQAQAEAVDPRQTEKQQAVEQWLRRVPDDPGGLLRRKFALEYQRRRREGDGE